MYFDCIQLLCQFLSCRGLAHLFIYSNSDSLFYQTPDWAQPQHAFYHFLFLPFDLTTHLCGSYTIYKADLLEPFFTQSEAHIPPFIHDFVDDFERDPGFIQLVLNVKIYVAAESIYLQATSNSHYSLHQILSTLKVYQVMFLQVVSSHST